MRSTSLASRILALKKRGFRRILDAEEKHLTQSGELIAGLRRAIGEIGR